MNTKFMPSGCMTNGQQYPKTYLFMKSICGEEYLDLDAGAAGSYRLSKSTISMLVIAIDILCALSFFIAFLILKMF